MDFLFGLAKNERLIAAIAPELERAAAKSRRSGRPAHRFKSFMWRTRTTWSRKRHVVAKAECTQAGQSALRGHLAAAGRVQGQVSLREGLLRPRRDGEPDQGVPARPLCGSRLGRHNAGQPAAHLWFYSMAYVLLCALRRIGLRDTDFANATCGTIRLKLLKIGALVRVSVRRIRIAMASACPAAQDWGRAAIRLAIAAIARASPA